MTRRDFVKTMLYLEAACGKKMPVEAAEVYFDLLGDLPLESLMTSVKRVTIEHRWANFPTVAELRSAAIETIQGHIKELSPAEAWEAAWRAAGSIDLEIDGSCERHMSKLPTLVQEAMRSFGISALIYGKEPVAVVRGQFLKIFEQLAARERRTALLPDSVKQEIARIGVAKKKIVDSIVAQIGRYVDG